MSINYSKNCVTSASTQILSKIYSWIFCSAENDLQLAKVISEEKSFFFVRTKVDQDIDNEKEKRAFNEKATLKVIREDCLKNLKKLGVGDEDAFLISSRKTTKWDFSHLTKAILDVLPLHLQESLTLSLTTFSKDLVQQKVKILRGKCRIKHMQ